eukprot:gene9732-20245_t
MASGKTLSSRRALFFEIIESGLNDRFPNKYEVDKVFKFCQYAKGETDLPPIEKYQHEPCEEYIDGLRASAWWDPHDSKTFPWVDELEKKSSIIAAELKAVLKKEEELFKGDSRYMSTMGEGWTAFRLQRLGEWNEANVQKFPESTQIVKSLDIPLAVRGVMFAKQSSGSGVKPHSDGRNFILTCHLGLEIPKGCWISVGGERREWIQNGAIIFDTSFSHETGNDSNESRYVMIIDFWHPDLTTAERNALAFVYDARNKFESNRIDEIDCSYVTSGKPTDVEGYIRSKSGIGKSISDFFTKWSG